MMADVCVYFELRATRKCRIDGDRYHSPLIASTLCTRTFGPAHMMHIARLKRGVCESHP